MSRKHEWPTLVALDPVMEITWWHDSLTEAHGYPVVGAYCERFWLPVVGPSALWVARILAVNVNTKLDTLELAGSVGLQANLAANAPLTKAVYRLIHFGFARRADELLDVRTHVDRVPTGLLARLPETLRVEAELIRQSPKAAHAS